MHAKALEIAWHDNAPIWSVDISRTNRVVTASGDKVARVWRFHDDPHSILSTHAAAITKPSAIETAPATSDQQPKQNAKLSKLSSIRSDAALVEWLCDLRAHATTINVARFSPDGLAIATAADLGEIVIWRLDDRPVESSSLAAAQDDDVPRERWQRETTLRGHVQDVLDLAWSADASRLVSASVDNAVMVWDVRNPARTPVSLRHHANFVQGVSIDPFGRLIASMGNDRALRVFTATASTWCQVASVSSLGADTRLFVDDSKFKNFFRRLAWSPDGSVLACPSGIDLAKESKDRGTKRFFAVHIFMRNQWKHPLVHCGGLPTPPCAVRFSPVLYQNRETSDAHMSDARTPSEPEKPTPFDGFSYRMIFAVACVHTILFYDTQQMTRPFACVEGLHCAEHTDITWSVDGRTLLVSSMDGYISAISFSEEDLGAPLTEEQTPAWLHKQEEVVVNSTPKKDCKPTVTTIVRPRPVNNVSSISIPAVPATQNDGQKLLNNSQTVRLPQKAPLDDSNVPVSSEAPPSQSPLKRPKLFLQMAPPSTTKTTSAHGYRIQPASPQTTMLETPHAQTTNLRDTTPEPRAVVDDTLQVDVMEVSKDSDIVFVSKTKATTPDVKPSVSETHALQNAQLVAVGTLNPLDSTSAVVKPSSVSPSEKAERAMAVDKTVNFSSAPSLEKKTLSTPAPADKPVVNSMSAPSEKAKQSAIVVPSGAESSSASPPEQTGSLPVGSTPVEKQAPSAPVPKMVMQSTNADTPAVMEPTSASPPKIVKRPMPSNKITVVQSSTACPSEKVTQSTDAEEPSVVERAQSVSPPSKKAKQSIGSEGASVMNSSSASPPAKKSKQNANGTPNRRNKMQKVQTKFFFSKPSGSGVATAKIRADVEKSADHMAVATGSTGSSEAVGQTGCEPGELGDSARSSGVDRCVRPEITARGTEGITTVDLTVSHRQQSDLS